MNAPRRTAAHARERRRRVGGLALALFAAEVLAPAPVGAALIGPDSGIDDLAPEATSGCASSAATPRSGRTGTVIVADNFESGSLTTKWGKTDEGDAWAGVTTSWARSGECAGRLIVSGSSTSRANIRRSLPSGTHEVWATGWFRVNKQGGSGSNVPTFRLFYGSQRILDVHRQNISGDLTLRTATSAGSWRYVKLGRTLALGHWYFVEVHVRAADDSSLVSVWLNGTMLYRSYDEPLVSSRLSRVMIGAEHAGQVMDLAFDNVVIKAR